MGSYIKNRLFDNIAVKASMSSGPVQGTGRSARLVTTDVDEWPYTRYFRGSPTSPDPRVYDREAGWRRIRTDQGFLVLSQPDPPVKYCFQPPCNTIFPCVPNKPQMPERCVPISP